ncbi:Hypothetical protein, putative [Bodo saltans]|uniref:CNH domain-containing protein n=1 Tax=Bodo saltans TaxID=75058 RepID=A0A0S4ISA6_BODSA|nr:Hypothetical protein, putative [Bodo saltans]|eukprot:CUF60652.1 Hypothetical protein, putative [Bodo saltans]
MVPIPEKNLLVVLIGEQIVLHSLNVVDKPGGPQKALDQLPGDKMPEIGPVRGAKDIIAFHIKKDRGVFYLAAILKKKVMVFELRDSGMIREFVVIREGLALPDGIRTVTWSGRGLLLGFRKEYVMMDITNGNIDSLFGTGRSNQPIVANLDPIQEMLIGEESAGIRVTLEGEPTAKSGLVWASLPSCMMFSYPYLLSIHDGNSIEVRNPLLLTSTLADQRQSALNTLCQTLNIKYVDRISSKGYVDFDMQRPNAQTDPLALRRL